jgi:ubiquinone biosynthesis monooxygenase Coq7
MTTARDLSQVDQFLSSVTKTLETLFASPHAERPYPATSAEPDELSAADKARAARYMRVNHVGEICAQALYQSQALTARDKETRESMQKAAQEEIDHLAWCEQRIEELGGRKSLLNPIWYAGSFAIGTAAGIAGDRWNLGFVAETEKLVVSHLDGHLGKLPENDLRSREVVEQMKTDEGRHAEQAIEAGAADLPPPVKRLMQCASKIMTNTAYWV